MPPSPVIDVVLYVQRGQTTTEQISSFLGQNITEINRRFYIQRVYVNEKNVAAVKRLGVQQTPCLYVNGRLAFGPQKIMEVLTPPNLRNDNFGFVNASPDELIAQFQQTQIEDAPEDEDDSPDRGEEIRRKMAEFQRKRPSMEGVKEGRLPGGRTLRAKKVNQPDFKTDTEFRRATGMDNIDPTPVAPFLSDADGDAILEEYRNETADMYDPGRKRNNSKKPRRRAAVL